MLKLSLLLCLSSVFGGLNPIVVKGTKFYDSVTKKRFMMKGIAYAPDKYFNPAAGGNPSLVSDGADLLDDAHESWWSRDIPHLQALGANVVRLYEIDPSKPHGKLMKALEDAGIYVIIGLTKSAPDVALPAGTPSPGCFRASMMDAVEGIMVNMGIYPNLLAFVVGNEIANAVPLYGSSPPVTVRGYLAMPCVKALARDARKFMKNCPNMRNVPLMYAATDFENPAKQTIADYLTCDQSEGGGAIDFYGINVYTWCAKASTVRTQSSYGVLVDQFRYYNVPLVLSEFGCNQGDFKSNYGNNWTHQRTWKSAGPPGLFSSEMKDIFSGGLAYQYSMTANDYGIVLLPGYQANQTDVIRLESFYNLQGQFTQDVALETTWNEIGGWTAADECTWKPPSPGTSAPACPSLSTVEALFATGPTAINTSQYPPSIWSDPLPTLTRTSLPCPTAIGPIPKKCAMLPPSPPTAAPPTSAPTPGNCDMIVKMPGCAVNLTSLTGPQTDKIFGNICGQKFAEQYSPDLHWCSTTFQGSHKLCTPQQQLDLALYTWAQWAPECCVPMKDDLPCTPYSAPTSVPSSAPSLASQAPSTAGSPTTAVSPTTAAAPTAAAPTTAGAPTPKITTPTAHTTPTDVMPSPTPARPDEQTQGEAASGTNTTDIVLTIVFVVVALLGSVFGFIMYKRARARHAKRKDTNSMSTPLVSTAIN